MKVLEARRQYLAFLCGGVVVFTSARQKGYTLIHFAEFLRSRRVEDLEAVTRELVEDYRAQLIAQVDPATGKKRQPRTVLAYLGMVRGFFQHAKERGWITADPAADILRGFPRTPGPRG